MDFDCLAVPVARFAVEEHVIRSLSPSTTRVYQAIIDHGPTTLPELEKHTALARRTVAYAIARLKDEQLIAWHARFDDFRYRYFFVHPRLVQHDGAQDGAVIRLEDGGLPPSRRLAHLFDDRRT